MELPFWPQGHGAKLQAEPPVQIMFVPRDPAVNKHTLIISSSSEQNDRYPTDTFKCIFVNRIFFILIQISLKFEGPTDNKSASR